MTKQRIHTLIGLTMLVAGIVGYMYAPETPDATPATTDLGAKDFFTQQNELIYTDCDLSKPKISSVKNAIETYKAKNTDNSLRELDSKEKASLKGCEIAKIKNHLKTRTSFSGAEYDIEITDIQPIEGGVAVFAKAWMPDGRPIGFGTDGSVEIERFMIYNPPIFVEDPLGDIVENSVDSITGAPLVSIFREDLLKATLETITHTISVKKEVSLDASKIQVGKIGNTTSTFFPNANVETVSVDGYTLRSSANSTWANLRGGAGTAASDNAGNIPCAYLVSGTSSGWNQMYRCFLLFDTSAIPDADPINSGTLSLYGQSKINNTGNSMELYVSSSSPASNTAIASTDHVNVGLTRMSDTDITYANFSTAAYNDYTLNAAGLTNISKTAVSKFGTRGKSDFTNAEPADRLPNATDDGLQIWEADHASLQPKLVVEHGSAAAATPAAPQVIFFE